MKILFCCPVAPIRELGMGKHTIELAEALREEGVICDIVSPDEVRAECPTPTGDYKSSLHVYLKKHAADYDVVDYDHCYLPFPRTDFAKSTLFVARSFLLRHHFLNIAIPTRRLWKSRLRRYLYGWWYDRRREKGYVRDAHRTIEEADLVTVLNDDDQRALIASGILPSKVATIALGLTDDHLARLHQIPSEIPTQPTVVSVATFDPRKGAVELPDLIERIWLAVPGVRFRLLGGRRTTAEVLHRFHPRVRSSLQIISAYGQDELPQRLAGGSVGILPSYIEGFSLGLLEMLAASMPVMAYHGPGAPMILPTEWMVPRGGYRALADKTIAMLKPTHHLEQARLQAKSLSTKFTMKSVARQTKALYKERVQMKHEDSGHPFQNLEA